MNKNYEKRLLRTLNGQTGTTSAGADTTPTLTPVNSVTDSYYHDNYQVIERMYCCRC